MSTWKVKEKSVGSTAASRSSEVSQWSPEDHGCSCTYVWMSAVRKNHPALAGHCSVCTGAPCPWTFLATALKASFIFGADWEQQLSCLLALHPKRGAVQAHLIWWEQCLLSPHPLLPLAQPPGASWVLSAMGSRAATQRQTFPPAASSPVFSALGGVVTDKARGAAWLFSTRLCPRSALWLQLQPASHPLQSLSIQTTAFMSVDSFFCFPNKANREKWLLHQFCHSNKKGHFFFFFHFPHCYFLPLSSCWLLLTWAYFLPKRGRSYWKAA